MEYNQYNPIQTEQVILCCGCGTAIPPNPANMCVNCIRNEVDITDGIPKNGTLHFCRNCERYLQPPSHWVLCTLESRELLALCIKKLKGLKQVRLIDAGFIWTEPHSRRIKVKLTIQKEVFAATILQQTFEVEFVVANQQCDDCTKIMAKNTWKAVVQVRQKVSHKRTFLFLEQLILKHNAHKETTNIKEAKDGIDFFYVSRSHAIRMSEFLLSVVPGRVKTSEQLISSDTHTGSSNFKFTYSMEISPICKDDLVCLPLKTARSLGNINPLCIVSRVSNSIHVIDPNTLNHADISNTVYYRYPFNALCTHGDLVEFVVVDIDHSGYTRGKYALADVQVARIQDFGRNDTTYHTRTHLGSILNYGDLVYGYDLTNSNLNDSNYDSLNQEHTPNIVLIKKSYSNRRKKNKKRYWKVKSLVKDDADLKMRKIDAEKAENDFEMFLRDIEEDPEMRSNINLYKDEQAQLNTLEAVEEEEDMDDAYAEMEDSDADMGGEDGFPEIKLAELLEDLTLNDNPEDNQQSTQMGGEQIENLNENETTTSNPFAAIQVTSDQDSDFD
ncbi:NMD3-domain-containing protein [Neoconidiobolus thromboides FSU 785]|nr:NMD3-domain-containing protein [Neoconidiobolus thromboides FSU 785]